MQPIGPHYDNNQRQISTLTTNDWKIALAKCKEHIRWRLQQKTLSGAHSGSNLGADPVDHYLSLAYEKIISGEWEWKPHFSLAEQMIRIVGSALSKEVERVKSEKAHSSLVTYHDDMHLFYERTDPDTSQQEDEHARKLQSIEAAIHGDTKLELLVEALKENLKRSEIAVLLELDLRQFDKMREKLFRRVRTYRQSAQM